MNNTVEKKYKTKRNAMHHDMLVNIESSVHDAQTYVALLREDVETISHITRFTSQHREWSLYRRIQKRVIAVVSAVWQTYLKTVFDFIMALTGIFLCAPIFIIVALLIKATSPGDILYRQQRVGKNGKIFTIYKFRSMRCDAEKNSGPTWATKHDPRVTPLGNVLRKSHLDELPQLFNVLKGDMSIIGPRPERPFFVNQFARTIPDYPKRLLVKPGITGLAQVRHSYDSSVDDVKKKIKYDIMYIRNMCPGLDLKVIIWTMGVMITGKGAH